MRVWGIDLGGLFTEAARGLYQLSGARLGTGREVRERVSLRASDIEGLLVAFLSELIYLQEHRGLGFDEFDLDVRERWLTGTMTGRDLIEVAQPLKAVTYHGLQIEHSHPQYSCEVVFDA